MKQIKRSLYNFSKTAFSDAQIVEIHQFPFAQRFPKRLQNVSQLSILQVSIPSASGNFSHSLASKDETCLVGDKRRFSSEGKVDLIKAFAIHLFAEARVKQGYLL